MIIVQFNNSSEHDELIIRKYVFTKLLWITYVPSLFVDRNETDSQHDTMSKSFIKFKVTMKIFM